MSVLLTTLGKCSRSRAKSGKVKGSFTTMPNHLVCRLRVAMQKALRKVGQRLGRKLV
jgi:hypothetical protein